MSGDEYKQNTGGMRNVGRTAVEGLDGPPSDAVAGSKRGTQVSAPRGLPRVPEQSLNTHDCHCTGHRRHNEPRLWLSSVK